MSNVRHTSDMKISSNLGFERSHTAEIASLVLHYENPTYARYENLYYRRARKKYRKHIASTISTLLFIGISVFLSACDSAAFHPCFYFRCGPPSLKIKLSSKENGNLCIDIPEIGNYKAVSIVYASIRKIDEDLPGGYYWSAHKGLYSYSSSIDIGDKLPICHVENFSGMVNEYGPKKLIDGNYVLQMELDLLDGNKKISANAGKKFSYKDNFIIGEN